MKPRWTRVREWIHPLVESLGLDIHCSRCKRVIEPEEKIFMWADNPGVDERIVYVCAECDARAERLTK